MDKLENLIKQWQSRESTARSNLIAINEDKLVKQVIDVLDDLRSNLIELDQLGEQHDYSKDLKYNGFRSFVKINKLAIDRVEDTLSSQSTVDRLNKSKLENCLSFMNFINKLNKIILETNKKNKSLVNKDVNQNRKEYGLLFDEKMTGDLFEAYFAMKDDFKVYFDGHLSFYLSNQFRLLVKSVTSFLILISYFPFSLLVMFNKKQKLNAMSNALIDSTITWPASVEIINRPIVTFFLNLYETFRNGVQSKAIYLPRQQKWLLKSLDECNETTTHFFNYRPTQNNHPSNNLKADGVRIKLVHHRTKPTENGVVLFHVHGGAFIYHSPDCHEFYLQKFVEKIPNLYIISVDYKLRAKYAEAHQDVLDAYLWLTSNSPDVVEVLGFKPKRILIAGDSAGAFLSFTLCKMMKDMQNYALEQKLDERLIVPDTIINFYGFATLNKMSPSWMMTFLETVITLPTLRTGFGSLVFGCDQPRLARRIFLPFLSDREENWYSSTNPKRDDYNKQFVEQIEKHPYLEPIDHLDFEEFKNTNLYLITSEFDVFLDANIELAKKWKGYVKLDIFDDISHGFLQLSLIDPISKKAVDNSIQTLKEAISLDNHFL